MVMLVYIPLRSVGCFFNVNNRNFFPMFSDGSVDVDNPIFMDEMGGCTENQFSVEDIQMLMGFLNEREQKTMNFN